MFYFIFLDGMVINSYFTLSTGYQLLLLKQLIDFY